MIEPIGSDSALPTLDVDVQTFMGLTVVDFNCNSSWTPEGGQCTIRLIQDTNQYLENVVVGSPQYFEILTKTGVPVFRFYGILKEISRSVDPSSKIYSVTLQSPTILLEATTLITDVYAGYGGAMEAYGANVPLCIDYGLNNSVVNTANIYNIQNVFGVYENETFGFAGAGFGKSIVNENGIRIDLFANAIHELVNGNPLITPALGSNIIYGADGYTGNNAYAYNFDIKGFLSQIASFIPSDYRVKSENLMDFVNEICSEINHIYYVDLLKPSDKGNGAFGSGHTSTLVPVQTHAGTVYGGQIVIITQNRNNVSGSKFPLSKAIITGDSFLAQKGEISDKLNGGGQNLDLPLDIGMMGSWHPDGPPVASPPYGGEFPVEDITPDELTRYSQTNISVRLNEGAVGARFVTGGYQSRINYINTYGVSRNKNPEFYGSTCDITPPNDTDITPDVYQYWGEINVSARIGATTPGVPILSPLFAPMDCIYIDCYDLFGDLTIPGIENYPNPVEEGLYIASELEISCSLTSYEKWLECLSYNKSNKLQAFRNYYTKIFFPKAQIFKPNGSLTMFGNSLKAQASSVIQKYNTSASDTEKITTTDSATATYAATTLFLKALYERVSKKAEEHYGKTYAVKCPAYNVKQDANDEAPLNQFIKSWDLADDAYVDPSNYSYYEAPIRGFVQNGRLKAHANYILTQSPYLHAYPGSNSPVIENNTGYTSVNNPNLTAVNAIKPSFSAYNKDEVYIQKVDLRDTVSVPLEINKQYLAIPAIYFTFYEISSVLPPSAAANKKKFYSYTKTKSSQIVNFLTTLPIPVNGEGAVPFALVTTKGVFSSIPVQHKLEDIPQPKTDNKDLDEKEPEAEFILKAIHPKSFCVPQQSNRYTYGPWITQINLPYGTKVEYVRDDSLVPENFLLPVNISIGGVTISAENGYSGMNAVGQLIANTVENFDFLFTEEGSVTIPGYPKITHLGQSLVAGGPLVSDLSVTVGANIVSTQYNMKTFAPKFGRTNKYVVDKLIKLGKKNAR